MFINDLFFVILHPEYMQKHCLPLHLWATERYERRIVETGRFMFLVFLYTKLNLVFLYTNCAVSIDYVSLQDWFSTGSLDEVCQHHL